MITIRRANERGVADFDWLNSKHSFSFGHYYDAAHMGFGPLRVINEDRVVPGEGFPTHGHRDMEIISYVLDGALEHKDSIGTGSVIRPGDVQRMSAGIGISHSEYNHSASEPVHFLQIWIVPATGGLRPGYEQRHFPREERTGCLRLIASADGREGSVTVHQDVQLFTTLLDGDRRASLELTEGRVAWVQVARGEVVVNGQRLTEGDGAAIEGESAVVLDHASGAEVLVFDLPRETGR
ncbi:pirin family protein [Aromatoleum diolicum]|uniref:Pirin family protein n=1 Tax=Aromatoleum diolicum TaxID=75796 RepID=A0ABX1Q805_9RHOO|nr:pirin family protein [Aromatoleum diolicum]NMG74494.1 pirin family protein [Aromatoleum diolicum]